MTGTQPDPRIAFFDSHADRWDSYGPPIAEVLARLDALRSVLPLAPSMDVLEIGCGTGNVTGWLATVVRPGRVTAMDFSPKMLALAAARGVDAELRLADVCSDDLGSSRFDAAFCMHVFPHFRDHAAALRNIARALKPAGWLIVLHLVGRQTVNSVHTDAGGPVAGDHLPAPDVWPQLLTPAGLEMAQLTDRPDLFLVTARKRASVARLDDNVPGRDL